MRTAHLNRFILFRLSPLAVYVTAILATAAPALGHSAPGTSRANDATASSQPSAAQSRASELKLYASRTSSPAALSPLRRGSTIHVTRCDDEARPGTLRRAVLTAHSGDIIDLGGLVCSTLTLSSGAIAVTVDDLTVQGPRSGTLTIDGHLTDRVFAHSGRGTLDIRDLHISRGRLEADAAYGGCIHSTGSIALTRSTVTLCAAVGHDKAAGGGVAALHDLSMQSSELSANIASVTGGEPTALVAAAGGALVHGHMTLRDSALSGNTVLASHGKAYGGAAVIAELTAKRSTVAGNQAVAIDGADDVSAAGRIAATASVFLIDDALAVADGRDADSIDKGPATKPADTPAPASRLAVGGILTIADLDTLASIR
jgi:hypothetical protein